MKNSYPATWFKRPEDKERAESTGVGIEDMEDADLTAEGLAAKKKAMEEGHMDNRATDHDECAHCGHSRIKHDTECTVGRCDCRGFETSYDNSSLRMDNADSRWPTVLKCSFIEPGLVHYEYLGNSGESVYVKKETLDAMASSLIGKPIINEDHHDVEPDDFKDGKADGIVTEVWYNPADAMFHCSGQIWDDSTKKNLKNGYKVSVAYNVTKWGPGGIHNNVPYEREVLGGEYTHLAIVANPRYEGVRVYNSTGGTMKLKFWKKEKDAKGVEIENSQEFETKRAVVLVNGIERPLEEAINALEATEKTVIGADQEVTLANGRKVKGSELEAILKNADEAAEKKKKDDDEQKEKDAKNALIASMTSDHKDGKHDDKELEDCGMCNSAKVLKNAHASHPVEKPVENCALCNKAHFERIEKLNNSRKDGLPAFTEPVNGFAAAAVKYGSQKPAAKA